MADRRERKRPNEEESELDGPSAGVEPTQGASNEEVPTEGEQEAIGSASEDDAEEQAHAAFGEERARRRRSEMSRRELRQRARRAKRAARGDNPPESRRRRSGRASPDAVDGGSAPDGDVETGLPAADADVDDADLRGDDPVTAGPDVTHLAPRSRTEPGPAAEVSPDDGVSPDDEVSPDVETSPGIESSLDEDAGRVADRGAVDAARPRGRRRRGKRRDRERARVQDLDPSGDDSHPRDRISGEVLFDASAQTEDDGGADGAGQVPTPEDEAQPSPSPAPVAPADDTTGEQAPEVERNDGTPPPAPSPSPPRSVSRLVAIVLALVALGILVVFALQLGWLDFARDMVGPTTEDEAASEPPADGWQPAFLLASVDDSVPGGELRSLAVLATDRRDERGTVLLVPTTLVADVPGFGSFTLREAWELGGSSLVAVTIDNLLGLHIDGVLAVDRAGWASWFEPIGGAELSVGARIMPREGHDGQTIEPGTRRATPDEVASYALIHGQGDTELDVLPRTRQVLDALFEAIGEDSSVLEEVVDAARTFPGTTTPDRLRTVLGELADHRGRDELTSVSLPVVPLGSGDNDVYRSDDERLSSVVDERFAASREDRTITDRLALQILNGNGRPGVGQEVAERLADGSYRIVLTGNADRFTYDATRIVVYSEDSEVLRAAQDIQERLGGIGSVERAGTPQSVVDVTIVVGHDFPP